MATISVNLFQPPIRNRSHNRFCPDHLKGKALKALVFQDSDKLILYQWVTDSPPVRPTNKINDLGRPHQDSVRGETIFKSVPGNWDTSFSYTSTAGIEIVDDSNMKAYSILCSTPLVLEGPFFIRSQCIIRKNPFNLRNKLYLAKKLV